MSPGSLPNLRLGFAAGVPGAHDSHKAARIHQRAEAEKRDTTCSVDQIYIYPTKSTSISASDDVTVKWDASCFSTDNVEIGLYSTSQGFIQGWKAVPNSKGAYDVGKLNPVWWNNTADASLQIAIYDTDTPRWFASSGPVFTVHASASQLTSTSTNKAVMTQTTTAADGSQTTVTDSEGIFQTAALPKPAGLPKGALAAAIVVPILVVGVFVGLYIKFARMRETEKRKRWSEHVDRRMSTISGDWRSGAGSVAGGPGGVRTSMASTGTRANSAYFANGPARASTYSIGMENNMAGAGAGGTNRIPRVGVNGAQPEMRQSQLRQSIFNASNGDVRTSRISFADDLRKSRVSFSDSNGALRPTKSNLSGLNTAGKGASPSTGERHSIDNSRLASARFSRRLEDNEEFIVSPSQASGPFPLPPSHVPQPEKKGLFSSLSSAVGKKDRKPVPKDDVEKVNDIEQYEATRRSEDAMRSLEVNLMRRSQIISQYSTHSRDSPALTNSIYAAGSNGNEGDDDRMEEITGDSEIAAPGIALGGNGSILRAPSPMGMSLPPSGMNPDQMLAAYAAARAKSPSTSVGISIENAGQQGGDSIAMPPHVAGHDAAHLHAQDNDLIRQSVVSDGSAYSAITGVDAGRK